MESLIVKLKNKIVEVLTKTPDTKYDFLLPETSDESSKMNTFSQENNEIQSNNNSAETTNIFSSFDKNLEFMKIQYNALINSDVVIREFTLSARGKQFKAFIIYIDGMVDTQLINDFILKPLMLRNSANSYDGEQNRVLSLKNDNKTIIKKVRKFNLVDYIDSCLLPQNSVKKAEKFGDILSGINSGNCALFVDTINTAFDIDVKGFKQRSINNPNNEIIIKGPQEAFVESIRTNTSLIRRIVNNENLIIENIDVGKISKTKCAVCYLKNIANNDLVAEVKFRLNEISVDSLLCSGELEQLISDDAETSIPLVLSTERPDKATKNLFEGKVVVLVNGNPYALIMPATYIDFVASPEDSNLKPAFANFLKIIRILSIFITLFLPAVWVGITNYHQELIPTELLFSIVASRENVPFPTIAEIILMEFSFELIREAGLRVPSPVGPTIGIVGALVLGQAAVSASIVSPILIIIIAITGIASFAIPDFSFGFHVRILRFVFILIAYMAGFLGIALSSFVYLAFLCNLRSFGVPYMVPYAPITSKKGGSLLRLDTWKTEERPDYLNTKRHHSQEHISMKWKKFSN